MVAFRRCQKCSLMAAVMLSAASSSFAFNQHALSNGMMLYRPKNSHDTNQQTQTILPASIQSPDDMFHPSSSSQQHPQDNNIPLSLQNHATHVLSIDEISPLFQFKSKSSGKSKVLNTTGLYHLVIILLTMPLWMTAMSIIHYLGDTIDGFDEHRAKFDYTGKIWCRTYLSLTNSYPMLDGDVDRLKVGPHGKMSEGACLFVANHASFLDIAVLCTVLDPVFKFIAKDSLRKFPGVGTQLVGVSSALCFSL